MMTARQTLNMGSAVAAHFTVELETTDSSALELALCLFSFFILRKHW